MDIEVLRSIMTVVSFVTFIGIVLWAWSGNAGRAFEEAAQLPFEEDDGAVQRGRELRR
jgi:cytochrome c oxidase cbb3-type subunit 4